MHRSAQVSRTAVRTEQVILAAALQLLVEHGFGSMSMRSLGAKAGLQPGSLYHHFSCKQDVLEEVLSGLLERRLEAWRAVRRIDDAPLQRLRSFLAFHVSYVFGHVEEQALLRSERRYLDSAAQHALACLEKMYYQDMSNAVMEGIKRNLIQVNGVGFASRSLRVLLDGVDGLVGDGSEGERTTVTEWISELAMQVLQVGRHARIN